MAYETFSPFDPLPPADTVLLETMKEAVRLTEVFMDETINADDSAVIHAAAWFFEDVCEQHEVDPIDALAQLIDRQRPEWDETDGNA